MNQDRFHVDDDIRKAWTLPGRVYADPGIHELARERIFARSWQLVADETHIASPGGVHPFTWLDGCIDEPLVLTRDGRGRVHCLSNVCTHRGNLVVEEDARRESLRCAYHGRRFGLDGSFLSMPEFEGVEDFPSPADDLPRVPWGKWKRFFFAAIAPAFDLETWLAPVRERVDWMPVERFVLAPGRCRTYRISANWALYCENYLEGFHIPYVHGALAGTLDYGGYRTECFEHSSLQVGLAREEEHAFALPADSPDRGQRVGGYYFFLFPNLMLNFYPWGLSINVVEPKAVDRTEIRFLSYVWDESKLDAGAGGDLHAVELEDEHVVENVHRGVAARSYDRGRYSPTREAGVHHFHRLVSRFLGSERS